MDSLDRLYDELKNKSDIRFNNFKIEQINSLDSISDEAYLEKPIWLGGDNKFVCVFIDLNNSTEISNIKQKSTVAKIYDYFTQNAVDVLSTDLIQANYIDIKGDGVFGLYEGMDAVFKVFCASVTFKTFFAKHIINKFNEYNISLNCKIVIDIDKLLVRKIGRRKFYNEVWAGKLINNVIKIASVDRKIRRDKLINNSDNIIIVSEAIYNLFDKKKDFIIYSCGHIESSDKYGDKIILWNEYIDSDFDNLYSNKVHYLRSKWCDKCGDDFFRNILE